MSNKFADVYTLDTTYAIQLQDHRDGTWHHYSQAEYVNEQDARDDASQMYGGTVPFRIIRIERHIIENERVELGADGCGCVITEEITASGASVEGTERTEHRPTCWNAKAA